MANEADRLASLEEELRETNRRLARMEDKLSSIKYFDAGPIQDRLARMETKIDVFWNGLSMDFSRLLQRGQFTKDEMMRRLERQEEDLKSLRLQLEESDDYDLPEDDDTPKDTP